MYPNLLQIEGDPKNTEITICSLFLEGWERAISGDQKIFSQVLNNTTRWDNPFVSTASEYLEGLTQFNKFFLEPSLSIFNVTKISSSDFLIDYQVSFWYPLFWRPRIIIPGTLALSIDHETFKVISVMEKWDVSLSELFLKQLPPRLWDVWHLFCSPSPEYPPKKRLQSIGRVSIEKLCKTVCLEATWTGLSAYPGPPLLNVPGFSLFGDFRTSRPNRDPFYTVLPVEVQSSKFIVKKAVGEGVENGAFQGKDGQQRSVGEVEMKKSSWIFHVPTALQPKVFDKARKETAVPLRGDSMVNTDPSDENGEDDVIDEIDYQVGLENASLMKSLSGGTLRANFTYDEFKIAEFESNQYTEYKYKIIPERVVATVDIYGDATAEKISGAVRAIQTAISSEPGKYTLKSQEASNKGESPIGLFLCNVKGCFNARGEPVMAIYEQQFQLRKTKVFLEIDIRK